MIDPNVKGGDVYVDKRGRELLVTKVQRGVTVVTMQYIDPETRPKIGWIITDDINSEIWDGPEQGIKPR